MNRRATLITSAAITGAVLAGTTAVAANINILSAADDDPVGELTVTSAVPAPTATQAPQVVDVYIDEAPSLPPATEPPITVELDEEPEPEQQQFVVEEAGLVTIERSDDGIEVDEVEVNPGWEWTAVQTSATQIVITFSSEGSTYALTVELAPDGTITGHLEQPVIEIVEVPVAPVASTPPASPPPAGTVDDDHDDHEFDHDDDHDDEFDDDDDDDDDHDDDHESDDDDNDDDEYEGGDDDD